MARINPDKLARNFIVNSSKFGQLEAHWDIPVAFEDGEEIVVCRRKDAFPVEIRNRNFEDRYTDVAQVEVFRGSPLYCSHLVVSDFTLIIAMDNSFTPSSVTEFQRDSKLIGRLIRDSIGQVFRITANTETELTVENIATNPNKQVQPVEGAFIMLADYTKVSTTTRTIKLLADSLTIKVASNSFLAGDKITINNVTDLTYGVEWSAGATTDETARNIREAIIASGILYGVEVYGDALLVEKKTELTLATTSNTLSLVVRNYAVAEGLIFVDTNLFTDNEIRYLAIQDADANNYIVKSNSGKAITLYEEVAITEGDFSVLSSFNNTYTTGFIDNYKSYLDALTKSGSGLEPDTFYYYTAFTIPVTSINIMSNELNDGDENITPYTIDKLASYYVRVFYESIVYLNPVDGTFTYSDGSGLISYDGAPDLTVFSIQVGDLIADSTGKRYSITSIVNANIGEVSVAPLSGVSTEVLNQLHGSITRAAVPANFSSVLVGDTFKDLAGNSFTISGTSLNPLPLLTTPPGNSFDVIQGLIDKLIVANNYLVPYTYNPADGHVQYGEQYITQNNLLSDYTYTSLSGLIQYTTAIDLNNVKINQFFVDGSNNQFLILAVNPQLQQLTIATGQTVDNTVLNRRSGSVITIPGYLDVEGNYLIDLTKVLKFDLLKTNTKAVYPIDEIDAVNAFLVVAPNLDSLATLVENEFDGSVVRRGADVSWIGFNNELEPTLEDIAQGGVKRYNSVTNYQFAVFSNPLSTQSFGIHAKDRKFGKLLYDSFPNSFRVTDVTDDLQDLMEVFGHEFNDLYALITTYELQNASIITPSVLQTASQNSGFQLVSDNLGIDTRRRVMRDLIPCYKLKGNREGIAKFIKVITTWDITNGTGDTRGAIIDDTPATVGLRFYSPSLGSLNTRLVDTLNVKSPPAGRFFKGVPGLALPGFFEVKEVIINLPNVALEIGNSTNLSYYQGTSILSDGIADFGQINSLIGCFLIPNEGNPNDFYEITSNTSNTLTVNGTIPNTILGAKYVVLSPLNLARFTTLETDIVNFMPWDTIASFNFTIQTI